MSFQFVDNDKIDGVTRKLIRRHVMKGKNAGKVRMRPRRKDKDESAGDGETKVISVPWAVGNDFSPFTFPCEMQPYMRELIHQFWSVGGQEMYPSEFCIPINVPRAVVFEYLLRDDAFFYCVLAMAEVQMDSLAGRNDTSLRALKNLSKTYRCIKQNLENNSIPSDSTIAAVMSMAIHEDLTGQPGRSKVHVNALQQMVELRGGITQLGGNILLLQKICRADIRYSLFDGSRPRFNRDKFPREIINAMCGQVVHEEEPFDLENDAHINDPELRKIFVDLMDVSRYFNNGSAFRLDGYEYQEILISVCYRLLHHYPLAGSGPENNNENACYLGLLALVSMLLFQHHHHRQSQYELLAEKLRNAIERESCNKLMEETTLLWLLFAGGISVFGVTYRTWLIPQIKTTLSTLKVYSWQSARDKIKTCPWVDAAHDKLGEELWQCIFRNPYYYANTIFTTSDSPYK